MQSITEIRVFISSPGDLGERRLELRNLFSAWNSAEGQNRLVRLEPVFWETHVPPEYGQPPQVPINAMLDACDFVVAIFWHRLGTPTDVALSGTVEELQRHAALGRRPLLYVCDESVSSSDIDRDQRDALKQWLHSVEAISLRKSAPSWQELHNVLRSDLTHVVDRYGFSPLGTIEVADDATRLAEWVGEALTECREVFDVTLGRQPDDHQRLPEESRAIAIYADTRREFLERQDAISYSELFSYDPQSGNAQGRYDRLCNAVEAADRRAKGEGGPFRKVRFVSGIKATVPTIDFLVTDRGVLLLQVPEATDRHEFRYTYMRITYRALVETYLRYFHCLWQAGAQLQLTQSGGLQYAFYSEPFAPLLRPET